MLNVVHEGFLHHDGGVRVAVEGVVVDLQHLTAHAGLDLDIYIYIYI